MVCATLADWEDGRRPVGDPLEEGVLVTATSEGCKIVKI